MCRSFCQALCIERSVKVPAPKQIFGLQDSMEERRGCRNIQERRPQCFLGLPEDGLPRWDNEILTLSSAQQPSFSVPSGDSRSRDKVTV